jgi:hypothetical protein
MVFVAVGCLGLTAFGGGAPGENLILDGKVLQDVSAAPGTHIKKSGEGVAIVTLKDDGNYTVSMDGPGTLYLVGTDDYSPVEVISKTGDGHLVWVPPTNPASARIGPTVKGKIEGKGNIRSGTQKEVNDLRSKHASRPGAGAPAEDLVLDGKGERYDVSAAPGTHIKNSGEGVAIVTLKDDGNYTVSMDGPGTLYLVGLGDYSSVEVISKTGDGNLVWVPPMNPKAARVGPMVKAKIDGKGKVRPGTKKEVNDLRAK